MYIKKKTKNRLIYISIAVGLLILLLSTVFAIFNMTSDKIIHGVTVQNINVSGLTLEEAREKIEKETTIDSKLNLTYNDYIYVLSPSDIDFEFNIENAAENAFYVGRKSNIFVNNFQTILSIFDAKNISLDYKYNDKKLDTIINNISTELPDVVIDPSYYIDGTELIIKNGKQGIKLSKEQMKKNIIDSLSKLSSNSSYLVDVPIIVENAIPESIDIGKIYNEVKSEPQDAYVEKDPFKLYIGKDGIDFAITIDEAKNKLNETLDEYVIPLKITHPKITTNDLGDDIFAYTITKFSTRYDVSNTNRATNLELATSKLNDVVIQPGEVFSYNKTVGERTISAGYKDAAIYTMNGVQLGLGGGICQVSSTLYNIALYSNMEIVERLNHRYIVSYVPLGTDATVSYGTIDFKFKNTRNYPVKLKTFAKNGVLEMTLLGIKEDKEYEVTIEPEQLEITPYETKTIYDASLPKGEEVIVQDGSHGYKYKTYKIVSLNGVVQSKTLISTDTYYPLNKIVKVSSKK